MSDELVVLLDWRDHANRKVLFNQVGKVNPITVGYILISKVNPITSTEIVSLRVIPITSGYILISKVNPITVYGNRKLNIYMWNL